jgi:hypothetical protein
MDSQSVRYGKPPPEFGSRVYEGPGVGHGRDSPFRKPPCTERGDPESVRAPTPTPHGARAGSAYRWPVNKSPDASTPVSTGRGPGTGGHCLRAAIVDPEAQVSAMERSHPG